MDWMGPEKEFGGNTPCYGEHRLKGQPPRPGDGDAGGIEEKR